MLFLIAHAFWLKYNQNKRLWPTESGVDNNGAREWS
jgi:hypothetical protein